MRAGNRELEVSLIEGAGAKPALVLLHEGLGSARLWGDVPQRLADETGCTVINYSRYGNGFSETLSEKRTTRYMHDEALVVLPELLREVHIDDCILLGHSDGASIAIIYAGSSLPVRGLILEAPHVFVEDLSVQSIAAARVAYESGDLRKRLARHHADSDRTFYGWNDIWLDTAFRDWNIEEYAWRITAPVLLVQGENDEYGTGEQLRAIRRASTGPVDELFVANAGHAPHRDRPNLVVPAISAFVRELCG
ncbi:MAG: alpha/beta hydrolase [Candidatus Eremiobacteraeota bacterium]|nr:alpha/beta hydrolase [Candidatus Eremiobacteraeota bacterium]